MMVFLVLSVGLYMTPFFTVLNADMRAFFTTLPIILCIFLPAVTMRLWAEERKQNTWEMLLTFPMRPRELVLGKFVACLVFFLLTLAGTLTIPLMLVWLGNPDLALWAVIAVIVWQFAGLSMVIFLAGLQSIPKEIYEAAAIDGTGPVRRFWYVVRPMLAPAITINLVLSMIGGLKLFDQVWVMTGGGPGRATETLSTLLYKEAFQFGAFGYSIALAIVLTAFVAVLASVQYWLLRRQEESAQ
jgi:ABC-type sugar transport system permease subunit